MSSRNIEELIQQAEEFIRLCYLELDKSEAEIDHRILAIQDEINNSGSYYHTREELAHGARMAWRHNSHCIGRLFWRSLELIDARQAETEDQVAEALFQHLKQANNEGRIRSVITVFRSGEDPARRIRIWNHQLIRYAGFPGNTEHERSGDPASDEFTKVCQHLGWQGSGGDYEYCRL